MLKSLRRAMLNMISREPVSVNTIDRLTMQNDATNDARLSH